MPRSPALAPPPGNVHFPLADSVRGIAVLFVIFCHSAGYSNAMAAAPWGWVALYLGFFAVAVFFALSGFLLYRPYASGHAGLRRAPSLGSYARRRALRIIPAYWVALTLLAVWPGISGPFSGNWWVYYGFGQVYSTQTITSGIPVGWSICTEVTFYLLLPLIALLVGRLGARFQRASWWRAEVAVIVPFGLVGLLGRALVQRGHLPVWAANTLISTTEWFAAGMALAVASVAIERHGRVPQRVYAILRRGWIPWAAAALALLAAHQASDMYVVGERHPPVISSATIVTNQFLFAIAAAGALLPVVVGRGGAIRRLLASRRLAFLGLVSYGMYLWHMPLEAWLADFHGPSARVRHGLGLQRLVGGQITLTLMISTVVVAFAAGTASYYLVELPFLRRKERRPATAVAVPVGAEPAAASAASGRLC